MNEPTPLQKKAKKILGCDCDACCWIIHNVPTKQRTWVCAMSRNILADLKGAAMVELTGDGMADTLTDEEFDGVNGDAQARHQLVKSCVAAMAIQVMQPPRKPKSKKRKRK